MSDPTAGSSSSSSSNSTGNGAVTHKLYRTQLVRDCDLEKTLQTYKKVETCEIYGLHTKPIKVTVILFSLK